MLYMLSISMEVYMAANRTFPCAAISLESLRVLSRGPNYDIRNTYVFSSTSQHPPQSLTPLPSAIRMLAERFADDALALSLLRADLQSGSPSSHASATNAHALLIRNLGHCPFAGASPSCPVCRARPARPARPDDQYVALGGEDGDDGNVEEAEATARPDDHTAEERAVRRRRREAMVLHEGDSPIVREDIIEPWPAADGERRPIRAEDVEQPREWEFF